MANEDLVTRVGHAAAFPVAAGIPRGAGKKIFAWQVDVRPIRVGTRGDGEYIGRRGQYSDIGADVDTHQGDSAGEVIADSGRGAHAHRCAVDEGRAHIVIAVV